MSGADPTERREGMTWESGNVDTQFPSGAVARPNIIIVLADDMGWGDLSCYGAERISTPNIDRLAAGGIRATDAHSSSSVCTPSRYSVLTGRYAWRSPLHYGVLGPHGPAIIETSRPTIASILRAEGYATGAFGKWHLGLGWKRLDGTTLNAFGPHSDSDILWDGMKPSTDTGELIDYSEPFVGGPLDLGFEQFFGISGSLDMPPYCFLSQDRTVGIPTTPKTTYWPGQRFGLTVPGWQDDAVDMEFVKRATEWMESVAEQPFFLYLSTAAPHRPCVPPEFARGRTTAGDRGDSVFLVDWMVGEVMETLERMGASENTLVIFTSDNGAVTLFPEDGHPMHHPNGHWRGQKADVWEGGHREPFIAHWPAGLPAGLVVDDLICLTDLLPSIAAAVDTALPDGSAEDGENILSILRNNVEENSLVRTIVHHSVNGSFAVRRGDYKAIFTTGSGGFSKPEGHKVYPPSVSGQLYNLVDDPTEIDNLWDAEPSVVVELFHALQSTGALDQQMISG